MIMGKTAIISPCEKYRYMLGRSWDSCLPALTFIMLNPSTADAEKDDATIKRCISFAKNFGYGGIMVGNLFAFRATKPEDMIAADDPVGPDNDKTLRWLATPNSGAVCAWGTRGGFLGRDREVLDSFKERGVKAFCLKKTSRGFPSHPLYLKSDVEMKEYP